MNVGLVVIVLLLVLSFLGIPIYIALGIGTLVAMNLSGIATIVLPQKLFAGMNSTSLLAIPFFILAGSLMAKGITGKLIAIVNAVIGRVKGSLGVVTVLASTLFGAISGSGVATVSAIGGITIPAMEDNDYPPPFAAALASVSSVLGPVIPPSIPLIVYASCCTTVSVASLFIGSLVPGLILALAMVVYCLVYGKRHDLPAHEKISGRQIARTFRDGIWALFMPIIILGGIFGGIFTPTEAAAVSVAYTLFVGFFIYKDLNAKDCFHIFFDASISTATVMMLVGLSKASSYVVVTSGLPQQMLKLFTSITSSKIVILLLLNILFLILGMLMEANAAIIMMTPILLPLLDAFGIDPLSFGIIMSFNLCIGLVTPPVGLSLLVGNQIAGTSLSKTVRALLPMLFISIVVLMLVTYIPAITQWLPSLLH